VIGVGVVGSNIISDPVTTDSKVEQMCELVVLWVMKVLSRMKVPWSIDDGPSATARSLSRVRSFPLRPMCSMCLLLPDRQVRLHDEVGVRLAARARRREGRAYETQIG